MILLRLTQPDDYAGKFAGELSAAAEMPVVLVVDEMRGPVDCGGLEKIALTADLFRLMRLYSPDDVTWRCGDYAYYAARRAYPAERIFWMIEYDVRIRNPKQFFEVVASSDADFLAADLRRADETWFWTQYVTGFQVEPWRCLFPVSRLSTKAIDVLYKTRTRHSRSWSRRRAWPNDESFVATTIAASEMSALDFNQLSPGSWTSDSFRYGRPERGENVQFEGLGPHLIHPVLWGLDFDTKRPISSRDHLASRPWRVLRRLVGFTNRRQRWLVC